MIGQRKRIFAVNLWLADLALTTASFFLAYRFRSLFELSGHIVMPIQTYFWHIAIILPTWALLLPLFSVYSEPTLPPLNQIGRLSKAIGFAWLVVAMTIGGLLMQCGGFRIVELLFFLFFRSFCRNCLVIVCRLGGGADLLSDIKPLGLQSKGEFVQGVPRLRVHFRIINC